MKNFSGFEKNSERVGPFILGIGKYLINFGAVEFIDVSIFRNNIAHNPIFIGINENQGEDAVAFVGVPKWKKAVDMSSVPMISAESIGIGVDAVVELAENMDKTLSDLKKDMNTYPRCT